MDDLKNTKPLPELGSDAYKDVLASLSELDATGAIDIDYLEANKTRTFNFSNDIHKLESSEPLSTDTPARNAFTKERISKIFYGIVLALIFILLIILASKL